MKTQARFIILCILLTAIFTHTLLRGKRKLEAMENGNSKAVLLKSSRQNVVQTEKSTTYNASNVNVNDNKGTTVHDKGQKQKSLDENILTADTLQVLKTILQCQNRDYLQLTRQRGEYWTLKNYVMADHGPLDCFETVTYCTNGDYTFIENLLPIVTRWLAPISMAIFAPGTDFEMTIDSIRYARDCMGTELVRKFVTFHIFFPHKHIPKQLQAARDSLKEPFNCSLEAPYLTNRTSYRTEKKLFYPINVGRNLARESALTHFFLLSDAELYPSLHLVPKFLNMIARNQPPLDRRNPRVFALNLFEVAEGSQVPYTKTELLEELRSDKAVVFHKLVCSACHKTPQQEEWMSTNETSSLQVFAIGKRTGGFKYWEPTFIATHAEMLYDERQTWEGKRDKMIPPYIFCVQDYDFMVLSDAFMVHKPGIKVYVMPSARVGSAMHRTNHLIEDTIYPELTTYYGTREGCQI